MNERETPTRPIARRDRDHALVSGAVPRLQSVRRLLYAVLSVALVSVLPWMWSGAGVGHVTAQQVTEPAHFLWPGPSDEHRSIFWLEAYPDPASVDSGIDPCILGLEVMTPRVTATGGTRIDISCAADTLVMRFVITATGPRCLVRFDDIELERRTCLWAPLAGA